MQTASNYVTNAAIGMERALRNMPLLAAARLLPATRQEITRYVEQLLTPEEQRICDMATD
jgi:hypothetical protein